MGEFAVNASGPWVMIVAGEASGDLHGANLARALLARDPSLRLCGMGGREMAGAGVELLYDAAKMAVVGVIEVISHLGDILKARRTLITCLQERRPGLVILIDYPDFNLLLAAQAKKLGIPVLYYISPQVWAWRSGRVRTIKRLTDKVAVILPFEREFYARHGAQVDFVGHPLLDTVRPGLTKAQFRQHHQIDPDRKLVGLLPGSRTKEIRALLPDFLAAAKELAANSAHPLTFLLPQAPTVSRELLETCGLASLAGRLDIRVITEDRYAMMAACDAAMATSGTVLLELAILDVPTVAAYRVSRLTYILGRLLVRGLSSFSLVNLIAGRTILPELLQDEVNPKRIAGELKVLLENETAQERLRAGLAEVRQRLGGPGASDRTAILALELLNRPCIQVDTIV